MNNISTISREFNGTKITQRSDGYLDATAMCKATGKLFADYRRLNASQEFIEALSSDMGFTISRLAESKKGNTAKFEQGTWVHPQVAINLAQWCSPEFAVLVSKWVFELLTTGRVELQSQSKILEHARINKELMSLFGIDGNMQTLALNNAMRKEFGVNLLETWGVNGLKADTQEQTLTISDIAKRLDIKPRQINPILTKIGLQTANRDHKDRLYYELTSLGKEHGVYLDTGKKHKTDGSPVRQIKWYDSAIELVKTHLETDFALTGGAA